MTHQYGNSGNDVAICRVGNIPEHGTSLHIKVDISAGCQILTLIFEYFFGGGISINIL
jgi:hypothetical protein